MQLAARPRQAAVDVFIIVVLAVHGGLFLHERQQQHRFDTVADEIAGYLQEVGADRVAWPADARAAVSRFRDRGVTPVLYTASPPPPQLLAVNDTPVVGLPAGSEELTGVAPVEEEAAGGWRFVLVDLDEAARVPLEVGEQVGEEYARPFVYPPLRESRALTADDPLVVDLRLAPGTYTFGLRVLAPDSNRRRTVLLSAAARDGPADEANAGVGPVAREAATLRFEVMGSSPTGVALVARDPADGPDRTPLRVHRWWVVRER